jgi:hypothetical protein
MLLLKTKVEINTPTLDVVDFYDTTGAYSLANQGGYGTPNLEYSDIGKVRLLVSLYPNQINIQRLTEGDTFVQNKEYIKIEGDASTIDSKSFSVSNVFTPMIGGLSVPTDDVWEWTGRVVINSDTYVPNNSNNPLYISLDDFQQSGDTIQDGIYTIEYEVYENQNALPISAVAESTYIVGGTGTVSYNSNTYRVGERFTANNGNSITVVSGSPSVYLLVTAKTKDFVLVPNLEDTLSRVVIMASNTNLDEEAQSEIFKSRIVIDACKYAAFTEAINYSFTQSMITEITANINRLRNSLNFKF